MPPKVAAGCLVRAVFDGRWRYLIVHPSGNYNRRAPYSIPKGLVEPGETPEETAVRETLEETGLACRVVAPLGDVAYTRSRKRVIAFLAEPLSPPAGPVLEPADWEIDRAEFHPADEARALLHPDQAAFIDRARALEDT
ncbi:MAG: NUDIX domain-containing protein [Thermodesulfobacteriota bacterium]